MRLSLGTAACCAAIFSTLAGCGGQPEDTPSPKAVQRQPAAPPGPARPTSVAAQASPLPIDRDDLVSLTKQVAQLRREVADIRQQLARMPTAARASEALPDPRTDDNARADAERADAQRVAASEAAFRSEPVDASWSQGSSASVRSALTQGSDTLGHQVRSVECRSHSCRVEINAEGSDAMGQDLPIVLGQLAQTFPNVAAGQVDQGNGRQATVLYLSR